MRRKTGEAERILREQGARVTPQRVAILKAVESSGSHPDADSVYRNVSREYPHISRDTVYRTLSMMEEKRIIGSVLSFGNAKRYDPNTARHHHLICIRCRTIFDFDAEKFDRLEPPVSMIERFKVFRTTVHVEGECHDCQDRKDA
ncbi:MAG: transcriptional repressor [Deltaproteobacteria bacterium]|nr:transcriptional repressor [Deltaproteobacteria bacterium]